MRHELLEDLVHDRRIVPSGPDDADGPVALELAEEGPNRRRVITDGGVDGDRRVTVEQVAELLQNPALGDGGSSGGEVVERVGGLQGAGIGSECLDADDPLTGGGDHLFDIEERNDLALASQTFQAGAGQYRGVIEAGPQLVDPRVHIASHLFELQPRVESAELRAASWSARADGGAGREPTRRNTVELNPGIARISAIEEGGQDEVVRNDRRHVLEAMHGQVDLAAPQGLLQLLDEQPLASDRGERQVRALVAGGLDRDDLRAVAGAGETVHHGIGLPEREPAAAGTDSQWCRHLRPKIFLMVRRSDSLSSVASPPSRSCRMG